MADILVQKYVVSFERLQNTQNRYKVMTQTSVKFPGQES
jgi:hypothetical protein